MPEARSAATPDKVPAVSRGTRYLVGLGIVALVALYYENKNGFTGKPWGLLDEFQELLSEQVTALEKRYAEFEAWSEMTPEERAEAKQQELIDAGSRVITGPESFRGDVAQEKAYLKRMDEFLDALGIHLTDAELRKILTSRGFTYNGESFMLLQTSDGKFQFSGMGKVVPSLPVIDAYNDKLVEPSSVPPSVRPVSETPTAPPIVETQIEYTLTDKDGITQGIKELRDNWPKDKPMPEWLRALDSREKLAAWAEANGFYRPDEVRDSIVMHKGDRLAVDSIGKLVVQTAEGYTDTVTDTNGKRMPGSFSKRGFLDTM